MQSLLVIDDEASVCYSFRRIFEGREVHVLTAQTAAAGLEQVRQAAPDVVILDLHLPDRDGMDLFREIHAEDPKRPIVFITAHGTADTAIRAMKEGAWDYLVKPVDFERVSVVIERALEAARLMRVPARLPAEDSGDRIIGRSPVLQEMSKAIGRIAPQDVNVLILGESGAGKELVARAIYHHSRRADQPFMAINCAAIPENLLESELFGHEQGAFTGAARRRVGKFEQCDGGTLLLDEIGDMAPAVQAKMLRVLQEQRFEPLGSNDSLQTNVRVLAATNHDLARDVAEGSFRKDLYYRLKVATVTVPPLRERREDIPELAHHFLFRFSAELGRDLRGFTPEALTMLQEYDWPGNVRELQGAIKEAILMATGHLLRPEFLPGGITSRPAALASQAGALTADDGTLLNALVERLAQQGDKDIYNAVIQRVERALLSAVLRRTRGRQSQASELLGLHRATLRNKLRELGITVDTVVSEEPAADPIS